MIAEEPKKSPEGRNQENTVAQNEETFISPRFKSVAAMAGWDEESIIASLVVEDTPDRSSKQKRRTDQLHFKTPPSNSRRKRRAPTGSPTGVLLPVLNLEEEKEDSKKEGNERGKNEEEVIAIEGSEKDKQKSIEGREKSKTKTETQVVVMEETKKGEDEVKSEDSRVSCPISVVPCLDKLREELSCAICLEICFEPSTTSCGHSFCKKCLRSAADKCGKKCPKCRQLISNGRSCMVNTVLWNTIQLLFPQEVEARKEAGALNAREVENQSSESSRTNVRSQIRPSGAPTRDANVRRWGGTQSIHEGDSESDQRAQRENFRLSSTSMNGRRRRTLSQEEYAAFRSEVEELSRLAIEQIEERRWRQSQDEVRRETAERRRRRPNQDEDAALALRLQREEFLEAFRGGSQERASNSMSLARANLRAMGSRAINIGMRNRPV